MMKKKLLLLLICVGTFLVSGAQNREINFEQTKVWKKIIKKAKKENKLVFLDCYTSWCGPCKMLAKDVFTQDKVADFFNKNFVNAGFDMQKEKDGIMLHKLYGIKAFPTLLFVDPKTNKVVHRMVGAGNAEWLLAGANQALDPKNNLAALIKRYSEGDRDVKFLKLYLNTLASAYMADEQNQVASLYLNKLDAKELATEDNWNLINKNLNDPMSHALMEVMSNKYLFYNKIGKEIVDQKISSSIMNMTNNLVAPKPGELSSEQLEYYKKYIEYLQTLNDETAPKALAFLITANSANNNDYESMINTIEIVHNFNILGNWYGNYFQEMIEKLQNCDDKTLIEQGIKMLDDRCVQVKSYFVKGSLMESKSRLQKTIGDEKGAALSKVREEKFYKEGERLSSGRSVRAIRMN